MTLARVEEFQTWAGLCHACDWRMYSTNRHEVACESDYHRHTCSALDIPKPESDTEVEVKS